MTRHPITILFAAALLALLFLTRTRPVNAANIVIGDGTPASCTETALRAAVKEGGVITFNCGTAKTIILHEQKQLTVYAPTIIDGGNKIAISGNNETRVFYVTNIGSLTIRNMTVANGFIDGYGAGIYISSGASFTAENSTIENNNSVNWSGSAIFAEGDAAVTLIKTTVQYNKTKGYGAINSTGPVAIVDSIIHYNDSDAGGGAMSVGGEVSINHSYIKGNKAFNGSGGGLYTTNNATVNIESSEISGNFSGSKGGAVYNEGELVIFKSSVIYNRSYLGGGVYSSDSSAFLRLASVSIRSNLAIEIGGGIFIDNDSIAALDNVTISNNLANDGSGGIQIKLSEAFLNYVTLISNTSTRKLGDNLVVDESKITVSNTIIGQPENYKGCRVINKGTFISEGHNLTDDSSCPINKPTDIIAIDLELQKPADNGGNMWTHMPGSNNSPAVDAGLCSSGLVVDQRGAERPAGNGCDIGAIEYGALFWKAYAPQIIR